MNRILNTTQPTAEASIFDVSARVPLGVDVPVSGQDALAEGVRPFGLRFARELPPGEPVPASRYCPERQIALSVEPGSEGRAWFEVVGTSMTTTGESPDGQGSTGNEEWTPDKSTFG